MAFERTVSVFLKRPIDPERRPLMTPIPRANLQAHSGTLRRFLASCEVENEDHREITLPTGSPGGLKHVLGIIRIHGNKEDLFINTAGMRLARSIAVWEACGILELEPKSAVDKLMGYVCWGLSHDKTTPEIVEKINTVFFPSNDSEDVMRRRPWDSLIHQYVWDLMHGVYTWMVYQ